MTIVKPRKIWQAPLRRIVIADGSIICDPPVLLSVVVVDRAGPSHIDKLVARWLHVACFIRCPAGQDRLRSVPRPGHDKSGVRDGQDGVHQLRIRPALTTIRTDLDARDATMPRPGDAANLPRTEPGHDLDLSSRPGDGRLGFHEEGELARRAVRQWISVFGGFLASFKWLVAKFQSAQPLHVDVPFPPRQHQARRVPLLWTQRFAVLTVSHEGIVGHLLDGHAPTEYGSVLSFGKHPLCARLDANLIHQ